jgi:acyl-CoA reductase-like NAD-dependent aldehyde dehydrogenase
VLNVVQARREDAAEVTDALVSHKAIRKVEFVGSAGVGRIIGSLCAKYLKPILMELGGKGPALVLDDADLEDAAKKCIAGGKQRRPTEARIRGLNSNIAFLHHGQLCFSTERIIVLEKIAPRFTELLKAAAEAFPISSGVNDRVVSSSRDKLIDAEQKGAKFLTGGTCYKTKSALTGTVVMNLKPEMQLYDDEGFGPSVSLYVARDDAHAIEIANDTAYGLNAAIHTTSMERALAVALEIDTAQIHVNSMTAHDERESYPTILKIPFAVLTYTHLHPLNSLRCPCSMMHELHMLTYVQSYPSCRWHEGKRMGPQ